jgi:uncharacterized protein involved in exopolysaccharide biosynthesis
MSNPLDMQYLLTIIKKWLRPIVAFVILATVSGGLVTLVLPRKYLSAATIVPADPSLSDKAYLFGNNIQELKSIYGKEEDLDRLLATAVLDGNLNYLVDSFGLVAHYDIGGNAEKAKNKSFRQLKKNCGIFKTENGAIKIQVWDTDKKLAATLANALVDRTEKITSENNKKANTAFLKQLENSIAQKSGEYRKMSAALPGTTNTADRELKETEKKAVLADIESEMKMYSQLKTTNDAGNPALVILEKAYPSDTHDKPRPGIWVAAAFFSSLFFAILLAVLAESFRKKN